MPRAAGAAQAAAQRAGCNLAENSEEAKWNVKEIATGCRPAGGRKRHPAPPGHRDVRTDSRPFPSALRAPVFHLAARRPLVIVATARPKENGKGLAVGGHEGRAVGSRVAAAPPGPRRHPRANRRPWPRPARTHVGGKRTQRTRRVPLRSPRISRTAPSPVAADPIQTRVKKINKKIN